MARYRPRRIVWPTLWLVIITAAAAASFYYLVNTLRFEGVTPAAVFGMLLVLASVALLWRAALNVRRVARRVRG